MNVVVGLRKGSAHWEKASEFAATHENFKVMEVEEAAKAGDVVMMLVPDELAPAIYKNQIAKHMKEGDTLMFAHGFNIHYSQIQPADYLDVSMVAPKGPGHIVRSLYTQGSGVPCLIAVEQDKSGKAKEFALAYAAAIGAGIDISRPCGNMIVDIGGGTTDIAVISLGGTVVSTSIKIAGDDFDEAIIRYMRKKHNLLIGERTAEDIKIKIGSAYPSAEAVSMDIRGRNLVTGLPKTVTVTSTETEEALKEATAQIVEAIHSVLEKTPPELAADIADRGIVLTGGGSLLQGLEELIEEKTGINTMTAEDPMTAVAIGTGKFIEFLAGER